MNDSLCNSLRSFCSKETKKKKKQTRNSSPMIACAMKLGFLKICLPPSIINISNFVISYIKKIFFQGWMTATCLKVQPWLKLSLSSPLRWHENCCKRYYLESPMHFLNWIRSLCFSAVKGWHFYEKAENFSVSHFLLIHFYKVMGVEEIVDIQIASYRNIYTIFTLISMFSTNLPKINY